MSNVATYRSYLIKFMSFRDGVAYDKDQEFTEEEIIKTTPEDLVRFLQDKVYGNGDPDPTVDFPTPQCRWASLMYAKKAVSFFMPGKGLWNSLTNKGNPTRAPPVFELLRRIKNIEEEQSALSPKAILSERPLTLHELWSEYQHGLNGRKPAKDFLPEECKGVRYRRRKVIWDTIVTMMEDTGCSSDEIIELLYHEFGRSATVGEISDKLKHGPLSKEERNKRAASKKKKRSVAIADLNASSESLPSKGPLKKRRRSKQPKNRKINSPKKPESAKFSATSETKPVGDISLAAEYASVYDDQQSSIKRNDLNTLDDSSASVSSKDPPSKQRKSSMTVSSSPVTFRDATLSDNHPCPTARSALGTLDESSSPRIMSFSAPTTKTSVVMLSRDSPVSKENLDVQILDVDIPSKHGEGVNGTTKYTNGAIDMVPQPVGISKEVSGSPTTESCTTLTVSASIKETCAKPTHSRRVVSPPTAPLQANPDTAREMDPKKADHSQREATSPHNIEPESTTPVQSLDVGGTLKSCKEANAATEQANEAPCAVGNPYGNSKKEFDQPSEQRCSIGASSTKDKEISAVAPVCRIVASKSMTPSETKPANMGKKVPKKAIRAKKNAKHLIVTKISKRTAPGTTNVSQYRSHLANFMAYRDGKAYKGEDVFDPAHLANVRPQEILRWLKKKAFGSPDVPGPDFPPSKCRSASLEYYKKALSHFMPDRNPWDEQAQTGNPARSDIVSTFVKGLRMKEKEESHSDKNKASLSERPRSLEELWREYTTGIGWRKAAKEFTEAERSTPAVKRKYNRRKILWDTIEEMVQYGIPADQAMDEIYLEYGLETSVNVIIDKLAKSSQKAAGGEKADSKSTKSKSQIHSQDTVTFQEEALMGSLGVLGENQKQKSVHNDAVPTNTKRRMIFKHTPPKHQADGVIALLELSQRPFAPVKPFHWLGAADAVIGQQPVRWLMPTLTGRVDGVGQKLTARSDSLEAFSLLAFCAAHSPHVPETSAVGQM